MPIDLTSNGQYVPHIRWMASSSTWTLSVQGSQHKPVQLDQLLFDLWNIRTGWAKFEQGQAPQWVMDPDLITKAVKPGEDWRRAFAVYVYNSKLFGGENVREFSTSATGASMGIKALHDQFEEQMKDHNRGELPIVQFDGATPTKVGSGQTIVPQLHIVGWTPRPVDFPDQAPAPAGSSATPSPTPTTPAAQMASGQASSAAPTTPGSQVVSKQPASVAAQPQKPVNDGNQLF